ncbi:Fic family protein [Accumulibacter sp.]|uniref:Fic family protein n=1 Tax=Accumulibacter sp. TaxID=2053492 RepID=UPI002632409A|nr:Fic family protein [Accumulibacter sp.]
MTSIQPLTKLRSERFDRPDILKQLNAASRRLAELKGVAASMPNQGILISTLGLQEAKDSSEIENIVTTHDELFREAAFPEGAGSAAAKEVARYRQALHVGFEAVRSTGLLTSNHILQIQAELEKNHAGFRKLPGTALKGEGGRTVYTPPQNPDDILALMADLERFINDGSLFDADPLIRMALIHHQFESIHPFYDGNGRTGRIVNVLYLVKQGLLDIPVLYMSRHIVRTKSDYYRLLQEVRDRDAWEDWVRYMLAAVEHTAAEGIATIQAIKALLMDTKHRIRAGHRFYSQDLINNLFSHPYTKIEFIEHDLKVSRLTATKYLDALVAGGFLAKRKVGRNNYYINMPLYGILTGEALPAARE